MDDLSGKLAGVLLGTAAGDAFGLPVEGLSREAIARLGSLETLRLLGRDRFVSDDTEQAALIAQSLCRAPADAAACRLAFRRALLGWFLRLPWGLGWATLKAGVKLAFGLERSGVASAGNGAAMRAPVIGVFFRDDPRAREAFGRALAEVTHTEPRGVEGALFTAEVAAAAASGHEPEACCRLGLFVVREPQLRAAIERALEPGREASDLGASGFVVETVALAAFCFARLGRTPMEAIRTAVAAGGDTDTIAAIVGAWCGAAGGERALPSEVLASIHDGPFGPSHLRALAAVLARARQAGPLPPAPYSAAGAMARNLALYPVILAHGLARLGAALLRLFHGARGQPQKKRP